RGQGLLPLHRPELSGPAQEDSESLRSSRRHGHRGARRRDDQPARRRRSRAQHARPLSFDSGAARGAGARGREVGAEPAGRHYGNIDALMAASEEELNAIEGIGPIMAHDIYEFFQDEANRKTIEELRAAGVKMTEDIAPKPKGAVDLSGKTFVVTGTLKNYK